MLLHARLFPLLFPFYLGPDESISIRISILRTCSDGLYDSIRFPSCLRVPQVRLTFRRITSVPRVLSQSGNDPASHPVHYVICLPEPQPILVTLSCRRIPHDPAKSRSRPCPGFAGLSDFAGRCGNEVAASGVKNINQAMGMGAVSQ